LQSSARIALKPACLPQGDVGGRDAAAGCLQLSLTEEKLFQSLAARNDRRSYGPGRTRLFYCEPVPVGVNVDPLELLPGRVYGVNPLALAVADETVGIVGTKGVKLVPTVGNTLIVGTAGAELTPKLPIS
jgi:hypothetical protein